MTLEDVRKYAIDRGISRLCHFTPSRKLAQILMNPQGILATQNLKSDERAVFDPTDLARLDGHPSHICCSIEYPNAWYFNKARLKEKVFPDWVVLLIRPDHIWRSGVKFCPRNAAAGHGRHLQEGLAGIQSMFADRVTGANDKVYIRSSRHLRAVPTDEQAEVLIPDNIAASDILGVGVSSEAQAQEELMRLQVLDEQHHLLSRQIPPFFVAPDFYQPRAMSNQLRRGLVPSEIETSIGGKHG